MEQRSSSSHLRKDATNTPDVNGARVSWCTKQNLRCSVPKSDNFMSVHANGDTKGTSQTKIGKLYDTVQIDKQVLWLQITVHCATLVTVENTFLLTKNMFWIRQSHKRFQSNLDGWLYQVDQEDLDLKILTLCDLMQVALDKLWLQ